MRLPKKMLDDWVKITKTYSDFSTAATTLDIEVLSLAAGDELREVFIKHSAAFTGGTISAYTISVGIASNLLKYASAFNVFQTPSDTAFQQSEQSPAQPENWGAATSIRAKATSTGANLDAATAGSVDIYVLLSRVKT